MICENCNKENAEEIKYCFYCGYKFKNENNDKVINEKRKFLNIDEIFNYIFEKHGTDIIRKRNTLN